MRYALIKNKKLTAKDFGCKVEVHHNGGSSYYIRYACVERIVDGTIIIYQEHCSPMVFNSQDVKIVL